MSGTTCMICTDAKTTADMFTTSDCSHSFCTNCISSHIAAKIAANIPNVRCPHPNCEVVLDPKMCHSFLPKQTSNRWRDALCEAAILGMHGVTECEEEWGREDLMAMQLAHKKKWKRCPHCKIFVERIEGCPHITCRCGSEFCYSCGAKWGGGHACPESAEAH